MSHRTADELPTRHARPRPPGRGRRRAPRRSPLAVVAGVFGELLLTAGAVVLLFAVYTLWGTGLQTAAAQEDLRAQLDQNLGLIERDEVAQPDLGALELGDAYAIIRIPRLGADWEWIMVQGVEDEDLKNGPGHYIDSADPGELGNFSVAAHRSGHGEPFGQFAELRVGDIVEVETTAGRFTYQLDSAPDGDPDGNKIAISDS